jgi:molecular chaperone Hsp33
VQPPPADDEDAADQLYGEDDDAWQRVRILAGTVEDHEMIDPLLSPHRLLYRLFHDEGVRVQPDVAMSSECSCSRERVGAFIATFQPADLSDMREADGAIAVRCEFCTASYRFEAPLRE